MIRKRKTYPTISGEPVCRSCGKNLSDHIGHEGLCRRYEELVAMVIRWHTGDYGGQTRLRDFAEREIEARQ